MASSGAAPDGSRPQSKLALPIFGVPVRPHFTFILLLFFLVLSARGSQSAASNALYMMAIFASVLLHEFGHAFVARRYGIRTLEIVMYPIGGVATLERSPRPAEELWISLAGPMVNVIIFAVITGILFAIHHDYQLATVLDPSDENIWPRVAFGNIVLAIFNMIPAFPMDGGRVLRALLARRYSEEKATRMAATAGKVLAVLLGIYGMLSMHFMLLFIAMFVYTGASQENAVVAGRTLSDGAAVNEAMVTDFRTLEHGNTIREAADLLLATSQQDFPVVLGNQVMGLLGRQALLRGMASNGPEGYVAGIMDREFPRLDPRTSLFDALPLLAESSCALVMEGDRLLGLLTRENVSEFLMLRRVTPRTGQS